MTTLFELKGITKHYGTITALDNINLKVGEREIFTILGPNGSGKTTLLRIMAFIDEPTIGEIFLEGQRIHDQNRSHARRKSTMVFQKAALFNTTVYKNIAYGLRLRGCSKRETDNEVENVLTLVKLRGYENRLAKELSSGEKQRVSLARALVLDTDLLLLDEPTANLDPLNASIIEETISHINHGRGTTVVMATHNLFQAETLASSVALLLQGRITHSGPPKEILRGPSTNFESFARLENVFSGRSRILQEGTSVVEIENGIKIETALGKSGKVTVFVRPEDIIVSKRPMPSSARNVFKGKISGISDLGSVVKLRVDTGKKFIVQITKRSFLDMQLTIGSTVFLTFKASSVHMV